MWESGGSSRVFFFEKSFPRGVGVAGLFLWTLIPKLFKGCFFPFGVKCLSDYFVVSFFQKKNFK